MAPRPQDTPQATGQGHLPPGSCDRRPPPWLRTKVTPCGARGARGPEARQHRSEAGTRRDALAAAQGGEVGLSPTPSQDGKEFGGLAARRGVRAPCPGPPPGHQPVGETLQGELLKKNKSQPRGQPGTAGGPFLTTREASSDPARRAQNRTQGVGASLPAGGGKTLFTGRC